MTSAYALSSSPPSICSFCDGCGSQEAKETPALDLVVRDALQSGIEGVSHIEMRDVTDVGHVRQGSKDGRAIADGGVQLQLGVVAEAFESVKLLARHRMVNGCLQAYLLDGRIHSLQLRALTPSAWATSAAQTA